MYALNGFEKNFENLYILSVLNGSSPDSEADLKDQYRNYLKGVQPEFTVSKKRAGIELVFEPAKAANLVALFGQKSTLNDLNQESVIQKEAVFDFSKVLFQTSEALNLMKLTSPDLSILLELAIEKIFFAGSSLAGGGSSSGAIGTIWINPRSQWTQQDYLEFFVHELTHNLVFLDEKCTIHYPDYDALVQPINFAHSAVLRRSRPLDKVIHSLFVVYEVLAFRLQHFEPNQKTYLHPSTEKLFLGAEDSLKSLEKIHPQLLSEHLWALIKKVEIKLKELKESHYAKTCVLQ